MNNAIAKTIRDNSEATREAIALAIKALEEEVFSRLDRKEYFGTVSLQINFASGKPNWHRVTSDFTSKPGSKH